jgi:hypothetical protein
LTLIKINQMLEVFFSLLKYLSARIVIKFRTSCLPNSHLAAKFELFLWTPRIFLQNLLGIFSNGILSMQESFKGKSLIQIKTHIDIISISNS